MEKVYGFVNNRADSFPYFCSAMKWIFPLYIIWGLWFPSYSQTSKEIVIGFYNVENLFDTINNKKKKDDDFLPGGKLKWNSERYLTKLEHISRVISRIGGENGPDIIGLCEVENKNVVKDLMAMPLLKSGNYALIHFESPDERGIDIAMLYHTSLFKHIYSKNIHIRFPNDPKDKTRDILYIKLLSGKTDTLHLLINHFPSRAGGAKESEPKRIYVASKCRTIIDSLFAINYRSKIILMGDLNDEPDDISVKEMLQTSGDMTQLSWNQLYNPMWNLKKHGMGSIVYRKKFEMIDQILLSSSLCQEEGKLRYIPESATIFHPDWLEEQEEPYKGSPFRTYAGSKYLGGFSDHFPVYIKFRIK